jgi:alpha-beta hydrolase superfamily lysophospholipase
MSTITDRDARTATSNAPTEHEFVTADGTALFYRAWLPEQKATRAVFLFHRGHEHSGRFCDVVDELDLPETAIFAWDARGHGRSPGARGAAPSFGCIVKDIDGFVRQVCKLHDISLSDVIVLGHSVSAVAVAAWVHDYAPPIRAMVLLTPALRVKLYVPFAIPGLRLLQAVRGEGKSFVTSYVRSTMLTHDRTEARKYDEDPLIAKSARHFHAAARRRRGDSNAGFGPHRGACGLGRAARCAAKVLRATRFD